jgi:hypothetical protein
MVRARQCGDDVRLPVQGARGRGPVYVVETSRPDRFRTGGGNDLSIRCRAAIQWNIYLYLCAYRVW